MSSLNFEQQKLANKLWEVIEDKYLNAGTIMQDDSEYTDIKKCCLEAGITTLQIVDIENVVINKYYMKERKYHVCREILNLCRPNWSQSNNLICA